MGALLGLFLRGLYSPIPRLEGEIDPPAAFAGELQSLFAGVAESVRPAVVSISFTRVIPVSDLELESMSLPGGRRIVRQRSLGSGVIVDRRGFIITNHHVVVKSEDLQVALWDGRVLPARIVHQDPEADIALLKIHGENLQEIPLGNSESLKVGHWVLAIGSPFGLNQTVSAGIVSAVGRSGLGLLPYENFIQTDASINQGNSGGPLVDLQGRLVGINTAIFSNQSGASFGIGFAVPINLANALIQKWIQGKSSNYLGIKAARIDQDAASYFGMERARGALVEEVTAGSPADKGGIKEKDILLLFNGMEIRNESHFRFLLARADAGQPIEVELLRPQGDGSRRRRQISVTISDSNLDPPSRRKSPTQAKTRMLGITVVPLSAEIIQQLGLVETTSGVTVIDVDPGSPAESKGICAGDIIVELNERKVSDISGLLEALKSRPAGQKGGSRRNVVMLRILRNGKDLGFKFIPR